MTDYPVIFSAPMVLALLAGRKTMTRRLAWRPCKLCGSPGTCKGKCKPSAWQKLQPGDRLYVRESFKFISRHETETYECQFAADRQISHELWDWVGSPDFCSRFCNGERWAPSIHMPRAISRLTLIVNAVKLEPLQDITEADAEAEGIFRDLTPHEGYQGTMNWTHEENGNAWCRSASHAFELLWCGLHGCDSWRANPEVVATSFTVSESNIESLEEAA